MGMQAQRGYSLSGAAPQDSSQLLFDEAVLETLLGKGSFGCVFRATWRQQEVALKVCCCVNTVHCIFLSLSGSVRQTRSGAMESQRVLQAARLFLIAPHGIPCFAPHAVSCRLLSHKHTCQHASCRSWSGPAQERSGPMPRPTR